MATGKTRLSTLFEKSPSFSLQYDNVLNRGAVVYETKTNGEIRPVKIKNMTLPSPKDIFVQFSENGNFTTCLLRHNGLVYVGNAKRNPIDSTKQNVGRDTALYRALSNLSLNERPLTI